MARRSVHTWYVAAVEDLVERLATWRKNPKARDIVLWSPVEETRRLVDGFWTDASEPMLPGYVLVASQFGPSYIEGALGTGLLRAGKRYAALNYDEVCNLRFRERQVRFVLDHSLKPGQEVMVKEDARSSYAGMRGVFHCPILHNRCGYYAKVTVVFFESHTPTVILPYDHLVPCTSENSSATRESHGRYLSCMDGRLTGLGIDLSSPSDTAMSMMGAMRVMRSCGRT